ncbi:MAG: site-2 protease family protein [Clostridiales bacterium]|nr:site-2 protease family protein [Clostridiales bacterium]
MSIIIAVLIFGLIVVIHEFGHFIIARKCGVLVEEFAIGMGPILFSRQRNDTLYSLRLFPIGGFCKMLGEDAESGDKRAFNNKTLGRRAIILAFGAIMNMFLAFVIFLGFAVFNGFTTAAVREVVPDTPVDKAGLIAGDKIVKLNGTAIYIFEDLSVELALCDGTAMDMMYVRNGRRYDTEITPYLTPDGGYKLGFYPESKVGFFAAADSGFKRASVLECLFTPVYKIMFYIRLTIVSIIKLIMRQISLQTMSGPIGMIAAINESYTETIKQGVWITILNMINLCAILSANLGVVNLLPLPALDGGRLVFVLLEWFRGKPVPVEKEGLVHFVGFVLLMIFAVFIAYNDILKLIKPV